MSAHNTASSDHGSGEHREGYDFAHPLPLPILFGVFAALVFLTIVTVAQASFDLGGFDVVIVMAIATVKATLVVLFFMHVLYDKPFNAVVFISSFVFLAIFIIATLSDSRLTSPDTILVDDAVVTTTDS
ncbi:cytochrome oxidase subunit IV [Rhodopirellula maiorica SM1]|uniref:Cytochrome oxidase subunit IV n=1 Tax=Rhodopirellula maiorica SM1 TaxID=1265738 RepID=M5RSM8_9BACT|nr:cytochrome C oxidase subunit IV family protein [Rhodopirellula maiorica]EMI16974.1 cytochrome oxidase subunit IV [Rhodopirellula maiorica SM1]